MANTHRQQECARIGRPTGVGPGEPAGRNLRTEVPTDTGIILKQVLLTDTMDAACEANNRELRCQGGGVGAHDDLGRSGQ